MLLLNDITLIASRWFISSSYIVMNFSSYGFYDRYVLKCLFLYLWIFKNYP